MVNERFGRGHIMVNVGFICEGDSDALLFQSNTFNNFLQQINITRVNVINAEGCGNLLPHYIEGYVRSLENKGAEKIVIVSDLDDVECITLRKQQINARAKDNVIIAAKEIEAWYLADSVAMRNLLRRQHFIYDHPEQELEPFLIINQLLIEHTERGIGKSKSAKLKLAQRMLEFGFDFQRCSEHPDCPSATYFVNKLRLIGQDN